MHSLQAGGHCAAVETGRLRLERLQALLEQSYSSEDGLACGNLASLAARLYTCGLLPAGCIYSLLEHLRGRFQEQDVVLMHTVLKACGFKLRADDPASMKVRIRGILAGTASSCGDGHRIWDMTLGCWTQLGIWKKGPHAAKRAYRALQI